MGSGSRYPRRKLRVAIFAALIIVAALPSSAAGATRIGDTFPTVNYCDPFFTNLQSGSPVGQYDVPSPGVITSWSYQADASPPQVRFKVAHAAGGNNFQIVGQSDLITPAPGALHTSPIRLSVNAGDFLGLYATNGECGRSGPSYAMHYRPSDIGIGVSPYSGPSASQLNIAAVLEPDCDNDGFGDETQDQDIVACPPGPTATITEAPPDKVKTKKKRVSVKVGFAADEPGASFNCVLDGKHEFKTCTSPLTVSVKKGEHAFSVTATDAGGNTGAAATDSFKVRRKKKK
jgi:hypothetical protein